MPFRHNIRANNYDYRSPGMYFVTIVVHRRSTLFGDLTNETTMALNGIGQMIEAEWYDLTNRFPGIALDSHVVMPDHIHGVIVLGLDPKAAWYPSLGDVVGAFKGRTTTLYTRGVRDRGWPPFEGRFWRGNHYERILRNDAELETVRRYVASNPVSLLERREAREI
jgi:REP element-mobilizing transposase RayT